MNTQSNSNRTDIHRPSVIIPEDYEFVSIGPVAYAPIASIAHAERIKNHMARTGGAWATHNHGGNCHVCGSVNLVWWIAYRNIRTNEYIKVGSECAENLDRSGQGLNALNFFRKSCRLEVGIAKGKEKAKRFLAEAGLFQAWDVYEAPVRVDPNTGRGLDQFEEITIRDIVGKLVKYGSISEKQVSFMGKLLSQIASREAKKAQRALENEAAEDFPITEDRIKITGTVISTKLQESEMYGSTWKMLVKADAGWKVWCSIPGGAPLDKGARISFFAKVQPSRDDAKFGFGSRPTKLEVIEQAFEERPQDDPNSIGEYDYAADDAAYDASHGH